jgi:hypothetical protein
LNSIYQTFLEDTRKIISKLENPGLLENGKPGVPSCKKILNWTTFNDFCDVQRRVL